MRSTTLFQNSLRCTATLAIAALAWEAFLPAQSRAQNDLPAALVQDLHAVFGEHHARAVHAKGVILTGEFVPTASARTISFATLFKTPTPVTIRFSNFTGIPTIPDNTNNASPRGLAMKFGPQDAGVMDIVTHSFNGFPVSNSSDFNLLLKAIAASGTDAPKPTPLEAFFAGHSAAQPFLTTAKTPASFATATYFGVNAFTFTNAKKQMVAVRYRFVPQAGNHMLKDDDLKALSPEFLTAELKSRLTKGPIKFDWYAQIAEKADRLDDPSIPWPESRRMIKLGTISIDRMSTDQAGDDKKLVFIPANVPNGIAPADPMIAVRAAAYPISFGERQ
jgi:catalase